MNNNKLLKAIVVLYQLKSLYKSGTIKKYTKRYSELARHKNINCSESRLRNYISILKEYGYVYKDHNKDLVLKSKNKLKEEFGVSKFNYKISNIYISNLELVIKQLVLHENLTKQEYNVKNKLVYYEYGVGKVKGSSDSSFNKLKKIVNKNYEHLLKKYQTRYIQNIQDPTSVKVTDFHPYVTLSRKGIAKTLNRVSKSTGYRYMKRFKEFDMIEKDTSNSIIIFKNVDYSYYINYLEYKINNCDNSFVFYSFKSKSIWKPETNQISLKTLFS